MAQIRTQSQYCICPGCWRHRHSGFLVCWKHLDEGYPTGWFTRLVSWIRYGR